MVDYLRARAVANKQIRKWGYRALLRRASSDRECWAMEYQYSAREKREIKNIADRLFLISAVDLDVGPVFGIDSLVIFAQPAGTVELEVLRIVGPVNPLAPAGIVVYWEIPVR